MIHRILIVITTAAPAPAPFPSPDPNPADANVGATMKPVSLVRVPRGLAGVVIIRIVDVLSPRHTTPRPQSTLV